MATGKNKGLAKGGKKGQKKKQQDPFLRKVWYDVKAPNYFKADGPRAGRTVVTKTTGQKIETEGLKNRVAEFNMADLNGNSDEAFKKVKLELMECQGRGVLTDFHSMSFTRDKMCSMIKKKHTLIEAFADCPTTDGYVIRLFVFALTERPDLQTRQFCYAQSAQIRRIRKRMVQIMKAEVAKGQLRDCIKALIAQKIEIAIKAATNRIFPLDLKNSLHIIKAKLVKKPKLDITKLMEVHSGKVSDDGMAVAEQDPEGPKNEITAEA
jgi:small subunit ribosomal protein S3Ae